MSLKEFNTQFMINGDSNDDDEEKTSRSKTSVPLTTTDARVDSELAAREPEAKKVEKEKLVECDKQWLVSLMSTCLCSNIFQVQRERLYLHTLQVQKQLVGQLESSREGRTQHKPFKVLKKLLMHLTWRGSPSYSILRWKDKYSSTCLKYTCQICGNQVCKVCETFSKRGGFAIPSPKEKIY